MAWQARADAQQALAAAGSATAGATRPATARGTAPADGGRAAPAAGAAAGAGAESGQGGSLAELQVRWVPRLVYPWPQVFAAADARPPHGLVWLALAHAPGQALRLDGLANSPAQALAAADALRTQADGRPSLWPSARVARLEQQAGQQRVELRAMLVPALSRPESAAASEAQMAADAPASAAAPALAPALVPAPARGLRR
jgi:hypothetical protein